MKRFLSFMMALAMLLSMSVNAFAAEGEEGTTPVYETGDGSITITNATVGHNYTIYKIFDATFVADANGNAVLPDFPLPSHDFPPSDFGLQGGLHRRYGASFREADEYGGGCSLAREADHRIPLRHDGASPAVVRDSEDRFLDLGGALRCDHAHVLCLVYGAQRKSN